MSATTTRPINITNTDMTTTSETVELDTSLAKQQAAEILNIPNTDAWSVVQQQGNLVMVHYKDDADMKVYGNIRGCLIDIASKAILSDSFGYTPTAVASELTASEGVISIKDKDGQCHTFNQDEVIVKRAYDGVVVRVIWYGGKCYRFTHRRINADRSRWGPSKPFISMYEEAGGPSPEQLFDTSKPYSSTCYYFLVVDRALIVGTRQMISAPYIVFLDQRSIDTKRPSEEVAPGCPTFVTTDTVSGTVNTSHILVPEQLTLEKATRHLKYGYFEEFQVGDVRQLTGEAVIMYHQVNGVVSSIVKIHSPSYDWRVTMRGNNPNIRNQFYMLLKNCISRTQISRGMEYFQITLHYV